MKTFQQRINSLRVRLIRRALRIHDGRIAPGSKALEVA